MHTTPLHLQAFNPQPFSARRDALIEKIRAAGGGVAIIPTAVETLRNGDAHHDFRPASSFYYLTGFCEPEAVLVLSVTASKTQSILFCREKNIEREIWDGHRYGPEAAQKVFAMDACHAIDQLNQILPTLLNHQTRIFAPLAQNTPLDTIITQDLNQ